MLYELNQNISNSLTGPFCPAFGQRVKYTANTSFGSLSTANANLNGTGTTSTLLTGASNGTLVRTVTIYATANTTRGMIRFFIGDGETFWDCIAEVDVPESTVSGTYGAFATTLQMDLYLRAGWILYASTEKAETFALIAEGLDTTFP